VRVREVPELKSVEDVLFLQLGRSLVGLSHNRKFQFGDILLNQEDKSGKSEKKNEATALTFQNMNIPETTLLNNHNIFLYNNNDINLDSSKSSNEMGE